MSIFASYFWLWSIIGLLILLFLYTLGAVMNLGGFISPLGRAGRWLDHAPLGIKLTVAVGAFGLLAYPSLIHKLWADATAHEIRRTFDALPAPAGARSAPPTEQFRGLYDPTGTDGTYIIGWFGAATAFEDIQAHYERTLPSLGWVPQESSGGAPRTSGSRTQRLEFRDRADPRTAHYELVLATAPPESREIPATLAGAPTIYALRLGVVDPRTTTQVAWFIDCLVQRAPTFPTCEAMGWNPVELNLRPETVRDAGRR